MEGHQENSTYKLSSQRQRLRAIVDRNADLFDPPNTAEAFARLEAGMDEVSHRSSADSDIAGQNDMLDPPNTAERFARIEAAMDAVFARSVSATWTQCHRKKSKFETCVPVQRLGLRSTQESHFQKTQQPRSVTSEPFTNPQSQRYFDTNTGDNDRLPADSLLSRCVQKNDSPANGIGGPAFASIGSKHDSQRDTNIFRSSTAIDEFANKAYQSARAKYLC